MAGLSFKHATQSTVADEGAETPDKVGPNEWNAEHALLMDGDGRYYLGRDSAGNGAVQQIPFGMEALGQIIDADAQAAEVEANTRALRKVLYPYDVIDGQQFAVGRYQFADTISYGLTTAGTTDNQFFTGIWTRNGVALLKRLTVSVATTALSGTRNGTGLIRLRRMGVLDNIGTSTFILPVTGYNQGLKVNQGSPMLRLGSAAGFSFSSPAALADVQDTHSLEFGMANAVGTNLLNKDLFSTPPGEMPLTLNNWTGFVCTVTIPAAATSQTVVIAFNLRWDEWVPMPNP